MTTTPQTFKHQCQSCQTSMKVPTALIGQSRPCPKCNEMMTFAPPPPAPEVELVPMLTPAEVPPALSDDLPRVRPGAKVRNNRTSSLPVLAAFGGVVLVLGAIFLPGPIHRHQVEEAMTEKIYELREPGYPEAKGEKPYRKGKILMIQGPVYETTRDGRKTIQEARIDPQHFDLPDEIRADSPDEVETLVICTRGNSKVGRYVRGNSPTSKTIKHAYVHRVVIRVYDLSRKAQVCYHQMQGKDPKAALDSTIESGVGEGPDVAAWVAGLPAK